jgi:flagellar assembly factor FliW
MNMNEPLSETTIQPEQKVYFPQGIPGFQDLRDFVIVPHGEDSPFFFMQSIEKSEVSFVLVNPFEVYANYEIRIPDSALEVLKIGKPEDLVVYALVTLRDPIHEATANLIAPIVINRNTRKGIQTVLADEKLSIRERLFAPSITEGAK